MEGGNNVRRERKEEEEAEKLAAVLRLVSRGSQWAKEIRLIPDLQIGYAFRTHPCHPEEPPR
jgi:hypothetical protein